MDTQRAPGEVFEPQARSGGTANILRGTPTLEVSTNIHHEKPVYPLDKQTITIGRHPQNDIVIPRRLFRSIMLRSSVKAIR